MSGDQRAVPRPVPTAADVRSASVARVAWAAAVVPVLWTVLAPHVVPLDAYRLVLGGLLALVAYLVATARGRRVRLVDHLQQHGMTVPLVRAVDEQDWVRDLDQHPQHAPWRSLLDRARTAMREVEVLAADLPASLADRLRAAATSTSGALMDVLARRDELGWDVDGERSTTIAHRFEEHAELLVRQLEDAATRLVQAQATPRPGDLEGETRSVLAAWAEVEAADRRRPGRGAGSASGDH